MALNMGMKNITRPKIIELLFEILNFEVLSVYLYEIFYLNVINRNE